MKTTLILCIALFTGVVAWAQGPGGGVRPFLDFRKKKVDAESKAKAIDAAKTVVKQVPEEVKDKAKELLISPKTSEMRQKVLEAAQAVMRSAPAPPATAPAATTTTPSTAVPTVEAPPPPPTGPQPRPLQPLNLDEALKTTKDQIVITAQKGAFFDAKKGYGLYNGNVRARHPRMYIACEELEIFMKQGAATKAATTKPAPNTPAAKDSDILAPVQKKDEGPPIEKADARGPMVTVEKISDTGELQVGHCKHLIHDGNTGSTTLLEWPQVQSGNKLHKSTEAGCIMVIDKNGQLTTTGGHETIILQEKEATPKSRAGTAPAPQ
jgi:hypothetical protein